jgi:hypothetical protein
MSFVGHTEEAKAKIRAAHKGKPKTAAHNEANRRGQLRRIANGGVSPHGTTARYKGNPPCRCDEYGTAWREYKRARRVAPPHPTA